MKQLPLSEAKLLAIFFEESALFQAEQNEETRSKSIRSPNANDYGMEIDDVTGGIDEIDIFEAQRRAARR